MNCPVELQPFMRVKTKGRGMWIVVSTDHTHADDDACLALAQYDGWMSLDGAFRLKDEFQAVAVYNPPYYVSDMLLLEKHGECVWQADDEKKRQRIADLKLQHEKIAKELAQLEGESV